MKVASFSKPLTAALIISLLFTLVPFKLAMGEELGTPSAPAEEAGTEDVPAENSTAEPLVWESATDASDDAPVETETSVEVMVSEQSETMDPDEAESASEIPSSGIEHADTGADESEETDASQTESEIVTADSTSETPADEQPPASPQVSTAGSSSGSDEPEMNLATTSAVSLNETDDVSEEIFELTDPGPSMSTSTFEVLSNSTTTDAVTATGTATTSETSATTTEIVTGSAIALANILNMVNTNFINSDGVVLFKNFFETLVDDFDLRDFYNSLASFSCSITNCASDEVQTNIENDAVIDNALYVEAVSGRNNIENTDVAVIQTGDAYAGVNLVNIANTNVIDSNYLLVTMNAFQDVDGDIVFPGLSGFFGGLAQSSAPSALNILNAASVANNVLLDAHSGNNQVTNSGDAIIETGASAANTNVFNQLNTSLVGGQSVSIIFRVHGSWAGEIFGAPDELAWMDNGAGGIYIFDREGNATGAGSLNLNATNTVAINNNVQVVALTGENAISGADTALISTGNAYAGANIMNVANATVVGRNWILAIINIMGDFKGNIAFGRPDLWVGGQVQVPNSIQNGTELAYKLTVINNGDSPASAVSLMNAFDSRYLDIYDASLSFTADAEGSIRWDLPDLPPGAATEVSFFARVQNADYNTDIDTEFTVMAHETDDNESDNSDIVTVTTSSRPSKSANRVRVSPVANTDLAQGMYVLERGIAVERLSTTTNVHINETDLVSQRLIVRNVTSDAIEGVVLHDILKGPSGDVIHDEVWDLGTVLPDETIEIAYNLSFRREAHGGLYALDTKIDWVGGSELHPRNGTILVWSSPTEEPYVMLPVAAPLAEAVFYSTPEEGESILDNVLPKIALAAEPYVDIRDTHDANLARQLGLMGILSLLIGILGVSYLVYRYRRTWRAWLIE